MQKLKIQNFYLKILKGVLKFKNSKILKLYLKNVQKNVDWKNLEMNNEVKTLKIKKSLTLKFFNQMSKFNKKCKLMFFKFKFKSFQKICINLKNCPSTNIIFIASLDSKCWSHKNFVSKFKLEFFNRIPKFKILIFFKFEFKNFRKNLSRKKLFHNMTLKG